MWFRDPLIVLGALAGAIVTAHVLFTGPYLPYIDWSNHLALISVLAHGGESGALDFMTRSWAPTPYLFFYGLSAGFAQITAVDAAAKLSLVVSAFGYTMSLSALASALGRDPRQGIVAPLAFFGVSMGYGFASFVFATPFLFFTLAAAEPIFLGKAKSRQKFILGFWLICAYLGHALIFLVAALLLLFRGILGLFVEKKFRPWFQIGLASLPAILLAIPATVEHVSQPWTEIGSTAEGPKQWFYFVDITQHLNGFWGHLLERGSSTHILVMKCAALLWLVWLIIGFFRPRSRAHAAWPSLLIYVGGITALFIVGPNSMEWPSSLWMIYPRFGVIAAMALFLLPRPGFQGRWGIIFALCGFGLVMWNGSINRGHIERFNQWAKKYDPVRELIPKGARVLALTVPQGRDFTHNHPALGSLYFYHMVDGASYVSFMFDAAALPIRQIERTKPRAPFWRTPYTFNPKVHGIDFDYLVLRGKSLVSRTDRAALHTKLGSPNGWTVYKTKNPTPRPKKQR